MYHYFDYNGARENEVQLFTDDLSAINYCIMQVKNHADVERVTMYGCDEDREPIGQPLWEYPPPTERNLRRPFSHPADWVVDAICDRIKKSANHYYKPDSRSQIQKCLFEVLFSLFTEIGHEWMDYKMGNMSKIFDGKEKP